MTPVFIDFGGTLDGDGLHWSTQLARAFEASGLSVPRPALDKAFVESDRWLETLPDIAEAGFERHVELQVTRMLASLGLPASAKSAIARAFLDQAWACIERNRRVLEQYKPCFRYWVISNFTPNLPLIMRECGFTGLVEGMTCSSLEGVTKPNVGLFQAALRDSHCRPEAAIMIGDSLSNDIVPAKSLGFATLWIRRDETRGGDPKTADHVAADLGAGFAMLATRVKERGKA